jgi:hypothetical protein
LKYIDRLFAWDAEIAPIVMLLAPANVRAVSSSPDPSMFRNTAAHITSHERRWLQGLLAEALGDSTRLKDVGETLLAALNDFVLRGNVPAGGPLSQEFSVCLSRVVRDKGKALLASDVLVRNWLVYRFRKIVYPDVGVRSGLWSYALYTQSGLLGFGLNELLGHHWRYLWKDGWWHVKLDGEYYPIPDLADLEFGELLYDRSLDQLVQVRRSLFALKSEYELKLPAETLQSIVLSIALERTFDKEAAA